MKDIKLEQQIRLYFFLKKDMDNDVITREFADSIVKYLHEITFDELQDIVSTIGN